MPVRKGFKSEANDYAREFRKELNLQLHDPLCPWKLCKHLDVPIIPLSQLKNDQLTPIITDKHFHYLTKKNTNSFSATTIFDGLRRLIIHNDAHHPRRQASNIAHELSHGILGHPPIVPLNECGCRNFQKEIEEEANWLGFALLISEEAAIHIIKTKMSMTEAINIYKVSEKLIQMRLNVTGAKKHLS